MIYVVIVQSYEGVERSELTQNLPDFYPKKCVEVEAASIEEVGALYPGKEIYSLGDYKNQILSLEAQYPVIEPSV